MLVFAPKAGQVVRLADPAVGCTLRALRVDPDVGFDAENVVLTRLGVAEAVNLQFQHAVGGLVYVYVFGDQMGRVTLGGLTFPCRCGPDAAAQGPASSGGFERVHKYWRANRASARKAPVRAVVGETVLDGLMTDFTVEAADPELGLGQWSITLATLPEE